MREHQQVKNGRKGAQRPDSTARRLGGGFQAGLQSSWRCASAPRALDCAGSGPHRRGRRPGAGPDRLPGTWAGPARAGWAWAGETVPSAAGAPHTHTHTHSHSLSVWHTGDIRGLSRASWQASASGNLGLQRGGQGASGATQDAPQEGSTDTLGHTANPCSLQTGWGLGDTGGSEGKNNKRRFVKILSQITDKIAK